MEITTTDGSVFIYTIGVMLSALYLLHPGDPPVDPFILAVYGVTALGWTAYFQWKIAPQFTADDEDDGEDAAKTPPTVEENR